MPSGRMGFIFGDNFKIVSGNTVAGSHDAMDVLVNSEYYPASASYIDVKGYERFHVLIQLGALADAITFEVKQAEAADGTEDTLDATYAKHTCATDDDGEYVCFTIEVAKLATDHHFVTTQVAAVSGSNYASITYLLETRDLPVTDSDTVCPGASRHQFVG